MPGDKMFIAPPKWHSMLAQFQAQGVGYESYGRAELGDYGIAIITPEKVAALGARHKDARLVCFSEVAWGGVQDVAAWTKL